MKIENLILGRYYEIVDIASTSAWDIDGLVGSIVESIEYVGNFARIRLIKTKALGKLGHEIYINDGNYRLLNDKDTAKLKKELAQ